MKIRIVVVGKLRPSPALDLCAEYLKRMNWTVTLREVDSPKSATPAQEKPLILKQIPPDAFLVALDERGETLSSPQFAEKMEKWVGQAPGNEIHFLIGGADGIDPEIRQRAKFLLSFGKQTWPHMLVRVMLLEQIYRAQQILSGHPYHRA